MSVASPFAKATGDRSGGGHGVLLPLLLLGGGLYVAVRYGSGLAFLQPVVNLTDTVVTGAENATDLVTGSLTSQSPASAGPQIPSGAPLGIQNNNPGNIELALIPFKGQNGSSGGKATFSSPVYGIRAMFKNLQTYMTLHGIDTIDAIAQRWTATDVDAWATNVSSFSGIPRTTTVNLGDFNTAFAIVKGIIGAENGSSYVNFYDSSLFTQAWGMM